MAEDGSLPCNVMEYRYPMRRGVAFWQVGVARYDDAVAEGTACVGMVYSDEDGTRHTAFMPVEVLLSIAGDLMSQELREAERWRRGRTGRWSSATGPSRSARS